MFLSVFVSYICACVQHLQEGRKAQQYLDQCWKQMDNVSVAGGGAGTEKGGQIGVWCKYSVSTGRLKHPKKMLTGVTQFQTRGPCFHKCHLAERLLAKIMTFMFALQI